MNFENIIDKQINLRLGEFDGYYDTGSNFTIQKSLSITIPKGERVKVNSFFALLDGNFNKSRDNYANSIDVDVNGSANKSLIKGIMQDSDGNILGETTLSSSGSLRFEKIPVKKNTRYDFFIENNLTNDVVVTAKTHTIKAPIYRRSSEFIIFE